MNATRRRIHKEITPSQQSHLEQFADAYGRQWKNALAGYWERGDSSIGQVLYSLRNTHGPNWLAGFSLHDFHDCNWEILD